MNAPNRLNIDRQILFGHWASLNGRVNNNDIVNSGYYCVWGGYLSAIRLEDRRLIRVASVFDKALFNSTQGVSLEDLRSTLSAARFVTPYSDLPQKI